MSNLTIAVATYLSYLLGSINCAIITCKLMALPDPRTLGSGNPGATNVLRVGGKKAAAFTLLGDSLKGFIPVVLAQHYALDSRGISLIALAAFLGHLFPIFFRFEGGKGVATTLGIIYALSLPIALTWSSIWLVMAMVFRYSSFAALTATALSPVYTWLYTENLNYTGLMLIISLLLTWRHRSNIINLMNGTEKRLFSR